MNLQKNPLDIFLIYMQSALILEFFSYDLLHIILEEYFQPPRAYLIHRILKLMVGENS